MLYYDNIGNTRHKKNIFLSISKIRNLFLQSILSYFTFQALQAKRQQVLNQLHELQNDVTVVIGIMHSEEAMKSLDGMRDSKAIVSFLTKEYNVSIFQ